MAEPRNAILYAIVAPYPCYRRIAAPDIIPLPMITVPSRRKVKVAPLPNSLRELRARKGKDKVAPVPNSLRELRAPFL